MKPNRHVSTLIIGAGISGLSAGTFAKKAGESVLVLEEDERAGGVIRSERKNGFLLEYGPNTVLPNSEIMELIEGLDLGSMMILGNPRLPRYIQFKGRLHPLPMGPFAFFQSKLLSLHGKLRLFAEPFVSRGPFNKEESVMEFARRRLGREAAERLLAAYVSGVWAGDADLLSASGAFPRLTTWERDKGSIVFGALFQRKPDAAKKKAPKGLLSFKNGLITLIESLKKFLGPDLATHTRVGEIRFDRDKKLWSMESPSLAVSASRIIFTSPAAESARLIADIAPGAALALRNIPYAPLVVIHLGLKKDDIGRDLNGFGFLIAPSEESETLGCLWNSSIFPDRAPEGCCLLTVLMGGARFPDILKHSDRDLIAQAFEAVRSHLSLKKDPDVLSLVRYEKSIPQYTMGHSDRVKALRKAEADYPGLRFAGNFIAGISVGDVVKYAKSVALNK